MTVSSFEKNLNIARNEVSGRRNFRKGVAYEVLDSQGNAVKNTGFVFVSEVRHPLDGSRILLGVLVTEHGQINIPFTLAEIGEVLDNQ